MSDDLKKLKQLVAFEEAAILDLGHVARRHGMKQTGLRNLTGLLLGTRIPKGAKTTNWSAPRLTGQRRRMIHGREGSRPSPGFPRVMVHDQRSRGRVP